MHSLSSEELDQICRWVAKGGRLLIGRDHSGHRRIKIVRGPFGLLTQRFSCSEQDVESLRRRMRSSPAAS